MVSNALRFTEHGHITISVRDCAEDVICKVADSGRGIAKENLSKVFSKFQQFGRVAGAGEKGTGLGLAIAHGIDPQASSTMPAAGMALASALSGGYVDLLKRGIVSNGGWALASGDFVYAASGSTVTATPPSASCEIIQRLGTAMTAESIDFEAEDNYTTITV